jgi:hypothetical protein
MSRARLRDILVTLSRTVREPSPPDDGPSLDAWLAAQPLAEPDRRVLASLGARRAFLYRRLVRRTLRSAVEVEIPRTAARLGPRFDVEIDRFLAEEMPRSHYLRDVAFELVEWARPRWSADPSLPPFLVDLARHELSAFEVAAAEADPDDRAEPTLDLERPVLLDASVRVRRYGFPVHRLADDATTLEPALTTLLVYRDRERDIRYLELSPLAGLVVEHLLARRPLGAAIVEASQALGAAFSVEESARFFADLADRGVLRGALVPRDGGRNRP